MWNLDVVDVLFCHVAVAVGVVVVVVVVDCAALQGSARSRSNTRGLCDCGRDSTRFLCARNAVSRLIHSGNNNTVVVDCAFFFFDCMCAGEHTLELLVEPLKQSVGGWV